MQHDKCFVLGRSNELKVKTIRHGLWEMQFRIQFKLYEMECSLVSRPIKLVVLT